MSRGVFRDLRTNRSPTDITWSAKPWGTRGRPKASASRSKARENTGRINGANQRSMIASIATVTTTSAMTTPITPRPSPITSTRRASSVATERPNASALNSFARFSIRSTWNGMNVNPMAKVFRRTRTSASV